MIKTISLTDRLPLVGAVTGSSVDKPVLKANNGLYAKYGIQCKSGIHIKPSHKGRFTEYKKKTGKTTEEAMHSKDPHVRKMAVFAANARKWKH